MPKLTTTYLPQSVYLPHQVRENEAKAAQSLNITLHGLMEKAGAATFALIQRIFPHYIDDRQFKMLVAVGPGNNAGDGYVIARLALKAGWQVTIVQMPHDKPLTGDAAKAFNDWQALNRQYPAQQMQTVNAEDAQFNEADLIVDAILGTGSNKALPFSWYEVIAKINKAAVLTISVDIPTGLNAQTGVLLEEQATAVKADHTVTFIALKSGLMTGDAADYCGRIHFADLTIAHQFEQQNKAYYQRVELNLVRHHLLARERTAHKHEFGHVVCIGGDKGMSGAISLAAQACLHSGAGLVTVFTHPDNVNQVSTQCPELMVSGVNGLDEERQSLLASADVILAGPGMGKSGWANGIMQYLTKMESGVVIKAKMVIDADALNWLANNPIKKSNWILTPHVGEAAALLRENKFTIKNDRFSAAHELAARLGGVNILKGAGSLISSTQKTHICSMGNPGMATAGMGDVLAGICAAMLAQGLDLFSAAQFAVCLHAEAGDLAAQTGERGLMASDLLPYLRPLINEH